MNIVQASKELKLSVSIFENIDINLKSSRGLEFPENQSRASDGYGTAPRDLKKNLIAAVARQSLIGGGHIEIASF
jgi:hypothetical protein